MQRVAQIAKPQAMLVRFAQSACTGSASRPEKGLAPVQLDPAQTVRPAQHEVAHDDADLASVLIASGVTTQSVDTVVAVLSAHRGGASINAAAKARPGSTTELPSGSWRRRPSVGSRDSSRSADGVFAWGQHLMVDAIASPVSV